ncbi:MAG: ABC transporter permease subunit [Gaiellales bacterium]|nr:ABC transporter permease subunit [Gaiellales bacterium]
MSIWPPPALGSADGGATGRGGELRRGTLGLLGTILAVFLLAALPEAVRLSDGGLELHASAFWHTAADYISGLRDGSSLQYERGAFNQTDHFLPAAGRALATSLPYAGLACAIALTLSLGLGLALGGTKREHLHDLVSGVGSIPDFILVLVLQIAAVAVYQATGWRIARVATISSEQQALLLPLIVLSVIPTAFLLKGTAGVVRTTLGQEFIRTALAQGLSRGQLLRRHVLPHALLHVEAGSSRLAALIVGNLFIVEYLFNIPGLGRLAFTYVFWHSYQPNVAINTMFLMMVVFAALWMGTWVVVALLRWATRR